MWTRHGARGRGLGALWFGGGSAEQLSGFLKQLPLSGAEQTVVADFDEARWEDMLEKAADELLSTECRVLEFVSGGLFIGESDVPIFQLTDAVVADSDAKDVRGEILESLGA